MKAVWKPRPDTTGTTVVLGDDNLGFREAGSKFIIECGPEGEQWLNQTAAYPGADEIETFDRGNKQTAYRVIVDYQFATLGAAQKFRHNIGNDLEGAGILEITFDGGGQVSLQAVLNGIQKAGGIGLNFVLSYSFLGGRFTRGPSTNQTPLP